MGNKFTYRLWRVHGKEFERLNERLIARTETEVIDVCEAGT
jgi:hypothetical protein